MLRRFTWRLIAVLALVAVILALYLWIRGAGFTEERVRQVVVTTIQSEAEESFLVTGTLVMPTTVSHQNTRLLLPNLLDLNLGTTESTVRVPGRVSYGFDVRELRPEHIRYVPDGAIEVTIPPLRVFAAEAVMEEMEVQTTVGWARLERRSGREVERAAIRGIQSQMRQQGAEHLRTSAQPRVNTARAISAMLTPVLQANGIDEPQFRFRIGDDLYFEPEARDL